MLVSVEVRHGARKEAKDEAAEIEEEEPDSDAPS